MTSGPTHEDSRPASWVWVWAEVAGAWAIALAWPIYSNIASGTEALTSYGVRRPDLLLLVFLVSLLVPLLITLGELVVRLLFGEKTRRFVHGGIVGALLALILWRWLSEQGASDLLRFTVPLLITVLIAWLYAKTEFVRNFAQILSVATVVVIVVFCFSYPIKTEVLPHEGGSDFPQIEAETPVVMVVLDEFPLAAIERPDGSIDPRFPNLSMLSRKATWYPGALAVGDQTTRAMPSMMTGDDPYWQDGTKTPPPGLSVYPDNLCQIAKNSGYEVHSYEPVTDFCEQTWDLGSRVTGTIRRATGDESDQTSVALMPGGIDQKAARSLNQLFEMPWSEYTDDRPAAVDDFVEGINSNKRQLSLLHIALPHVAWMYSPDGSSYPNLRSAGDDMLVSPATDGELSRDAQQLMLQIAYTDAQVGRVISKMKSVGIWEESLFVVTADHGAAFLPDGSRRLINIVNSGWVAPVPLFIKYPGQTKGKVVPGTVDGRDITPTVLSELGLKPKDSSTGRPLNGKNRLPVRQDHAVSAVFGGRLDAKVSDIRDQQRAGVNYMDELFSRSFFAPGGHAALIGKSTNGMTEIPAEPTDPSLYQNVNLDSGEIPAYYEAQLELPGKPPRSVAISLNGRVAATARPWPVEGGWKVGSMLPSTLFRDGSNEIRVYEIKPTG